MAHRPARACRVLALVAVLFALRPAPARAEGGPGEVGIGVMVGASYSPTRLRQGALDRRVGAGFAWGFFVDVPLTEYVYLAPSAVLYELDLGAGNRPVTDMDLGLKLLLPLGPVRLGPGLIVGVSNAEQRYNAQLGALAYVGLDLLGNLEGFAMLQYKRLWRAAQDVDDLHGYLGARLRF